MIKRRRKKKTFGKTIKAEKRGWAGMLSISACDFAEFVGLYENSHECEAFNSADDDIHEELIDASTELLNVVSDAICSKNPKSLEELYLMLDLAVGPEWGGTIQPGFWANVFADLGSQKDCFTIELVSITFTNPLFLVAGIRAGFFDRHILDDDLAGFLCDISECPCHDTEIAWFRSGAGILEIAKAWEARRTQLG